jgi:hypothetical protein
MGATLQEIILNFNQSNRGHVGLNKSYISNNIFDVSTAMWYDYIGESLQIPTVFRGNNEKYSPAAQKNDCTVPQ